MRKLILVGLSLALLLAFPSAAPGAEAYGCTATAPVVAEPVTGQSPSCTFVIICVSSPCRYVARVDANGGGLVTARMEVIEVFVPGPSLIRWSGTEGKKRGPSCTGLISCTAPERLPARLEAGGFRYATVQCSSGGLALVETISCALTADVT